MGSLSLASEFFFYGKNLREFICMITMPIPVRSSCPPVMQLFANKQRSTANLFHDPRSLHGLARHHAMERALPQNFIPGVVGMINRFATR